MDSARAYTDKKLREMEAEIQKIYRQSQAEIQEKWDKFMKSHEPKLNKAQRELEKAKKSGNRDDIKKARDNYERIARNITFNDRRYRAMVNETTARLANVNQIALDYLNDNLSGIYTENYNEFGNQEIDGYSFTLINERTVKNIAKSDKTFLPRKNVNVPKDKAWNAKNINSQLIQGILQGEDMKKIAKRLQNVTDMNEKAAIRNARTMVTSAENKGRQDSFKKATGDGVIMTREWIAAHDGRTRDWHVDLDGVEVGVDEPWINTYGEIMYPGDDGADPANVYNCRCSMRAHVKGFRWR